MNTDRTRSPRAFGSRLRSVLGLGSAAALVIAGVALVGALPASAANGSNFVFSTLPTSTVAGATFPSFTVTYQNGNGATDTISITSSCGLGGTDSTTASGSVATFNAFQINTGTSCTLTANDTSAGGQSTATAAITVTPAAPHILVFTTQPPSTAGANTALTSFTVKVEDQYNNLENAGTDTVSITSACPLGGTTSMGEVAGVATFTSLDINQVGTCYLIASDTTNTGITPATSTAVTVSGGAPAKVVFSVAPPASVLATGVVIPTFKAAVEDANGNIDTTGIGSTDSITLSSTCLAAPVTLTATGGVATFATVEFASTGTCTLTATDSTRVISAATGTTNVGQAQAALTVTTKSGYLDAPLTLAATGGSGSGAVTFSVTNGTATGCLITSGVLSATKGGTCIVTAFKAAASPYTSGTSAATTVTISSAPKALRLAGKVANAHKGTVTISGYNFSGRPKVSSNVSGFSALVTRDSGKTLWITITVKGSATKPGVKVLTLVFANGVRTSVRYSLR